MPIDSQELARRLAEADRMRVLLRKTTNELAALGREILEKRRQLKKINDQPERSDGRFARDLSSS